MERILKTIDIMTIVVCIIGIIASVLAENFSSALFAAALLFRVLGSN